MNKLTKFQLEACYNTYKNAIALHMYLMRDYLKGKITIGEMYKASFANQILIVSNYIILVSHYGQSTDR